MDERDEQVCHQCSATLERLFQVADICVPDRFASFSISSLMPTYEECAEVDRRNEEYLNRKKEPVGPTFEECLETACIENRVEPAKLNAYKLGDAVGGS